jgi:hypothetical protein
MENSDILPNDIEYKINNDVDISAQGIEMSHTLLKKGKRQR